MTNKPMLSVERELLQSALSAVEYLALRGDDIGLSNEPVAKELRALLDKEVYGDSNAPKIRVEPVGEVVHVSEDQIRIGLYDEYSLKAGDLVYAEQPAPVADGTASDKYKAELYDEVWQLARSMGFNNVTDALTGRFAPLAVGLTDKQILAAMREHICAADGGYVFDTAKESVVASGRELLEVYRLNGMKP